MRTTPSFVSRLAVALICAAVVLLASARPASAQLVKSGVALIDVDGDAAGTIEMDAGGADASGVGISLGNGTALRGDGTSSFTNGGEFTDGGTVVLNATAGSIFDSAAITVAGTNQGTGGEVDMQAATSITVAQPIDAHGGGGDGGSVDIEAGDSITVS